MVGRTRAKIQRSPSCPPLGRHGIDNRCLEIWLGSNRPGKQYQGCVDSGREESPHKLPRDESSSTSLADLCLDKTEYSHPVAARQLISHCIHKPQRGNSFQSPVRFGSRDLGVMFDSWDNNSCRTHSKSVQHCGRCRVEAEFRAKRLEATQGSFRSTSESMGSSQCGPICSEAQQTIQLPRYFSFKPDPEAETVDALAQCWSDLRAYAFYPFALIGWCLQKLEQEQVKELVLMVPVRHNQTWFPALLTKLIDLPILLPGFNKIITNPAGETHPFIEKNSLHLATCRVLDQVYRNKEFLMSLSESFQQHGGKACKILIHQHGESGYFGVVEQTPFPFQCLF